MSTYMLIMRSSAEAVAASAELDVEAIINAMGAYNESLMQAGVLVSGEGLADEPGVVVTFSADEPVVTDGPYGEIHELFSGFWMLEVSSTEEAIEWAKRCPLGPGAKLEIRRVSDESDFADFADNEYLQKEEGWRDELAKRADTRDGV